MIKLARIFDLLEPLRDAVRGGLPAFGTCAGMIMLADRIEDGAAGPGDDRRPPHHRAAQRLRAPGRLLRGGPPRRRARRPGARGLHPRAVGRGRSTTTSRCWRGSRHGPAAGRIVAVRQGPLMATSFHPEVGGDARVHGMFVDLVRSA